MGTKKTSTGSEGHKGKGKKEETIRLPFGDIKGRLPNIVASAIKVMEKRGRPKTERSEQELRGDLTPKEEIRSW